MSQGLLDRDTTTATPDTLHAPLQPARRRLRGRLAVALVGLALLVPLTLLGLNLLPGLSNPFNQQVVDRSTPALMLALDDLSEYRASTGTFQVVIDLEKDTPYIPSLISGERTTFLATGNVDALVDFTDLGSDRVVVSDDRRAVTISLPAPRLSQAVVDPAASRVVGRDRGLLDRIGSIFEDNPTSERELYQLAEGKIAAAAAQSDLTRRAQDNTRQMLTTLTRSLGFERVTVTFGAA